MKATKIRFDRFLYLFFVSLVYIFLLTPLVIVVIAAFNSGKYLAFPPEGFSLKWFKNFFQSQPFMDALKVSLKLGVLTMICVTILGTTAALYVVRHAKKWKNFLRLTMISPLLLPAILTGIALLVFYYIIGIGTRTFLGLLMGHVLITLPYAFLNVYSSLYNFNRSLEEAARSLGASQLKTFFRITLPLIKPGVISGAMIAFIVSFDQFPISLLLKGVGRTTLPCQLFDYILWDFDPTAAAVSTVSIAITLGVVLLTEKLVGLDSLRW
jgi:putative spermidine/putrescine transport system permease protein